jgi:cyclase
MSKCTDRILYGPLSVALAASTALVTALQAQVADPVTTLPVQGGVYLIARAGGNIAAQVGPDGVVLVDAGAAESSAGVLAAIKKLTDQPIRYIVNTSADLDHVGGNEKLAKTGVSIFSMPQGGNAFGLAGALSNQGAASIVAAEPVLARMSAPTGQTSPLPTAAWPTETYTRKQKNVFLNGEAIQIMRQPAAHSDGDSVVLFRRSDVVVTGDVFDMTRFPIIDVEKGGSIQGEIDALNRLMDLTVPVVPLPWQEGGTKVIPGHGRIAEQAEIVEYRDMVTIIRDRVQRMIAKGLTIEQVKAANPTQGFRGRFGSDTGRWTTDMFVEAVYKSLRTNR